MSQDFVPDDHVPYIGALHPLSKRIHVATGLKKWGITGGTVAAALIADRIAGRDNPRRSSSSSTRIKPLAEAPKFLSGNGWPRHMVGDRLRDRATADRGPRAGGRRDVSGRAARSRATAMRAVASTPSPLAAPTRLPGALEQRRANVGLPVHASRFDVDGNVLNGPAVDPLAPRMVE